jgi:GntR family transcriptional repressor for pyruvate dehydrogenase complex
MRAMSRTASLTAPGLRRPRMTAAIVSQVKDLIVRGALRPEQRLPSERDLARTWRVGRPTVREAIQQLETLGFIEVRPARGSFVRPLTTRTIEEPLRRVAAEERHVVAQILDVRIALEGWIAGAAATSATPADVRRIRKIVDALSAAADRGEPLSEHDAAFHRALVEATGNTVMLHMMESLTSLGASIREFKKRVGYRQTQPRAFTECHREVLRALLARDGERARRAMVAHLTMVKDTLVGSDAGAAQGPARRHARLGAVRRRRAASAH